MLARVLEGEVALKQNDPRKAIQRFNTARQFADSWLVRYGLGRAYLQADAAPEAASEFDLCVKRRGEATAVLLDDVPTYRYYAPIEYYQGRVHEALGGTGAAESYKAFLAVKAGGDEQGLVADARRRLK
jgi:predicted Zn-dependent protease